MQSRYIQSDIRIALSYVATLAKAHRIACASADRVFEKFASGKDVL